MTVLTDWETMMIARLSEPTPLFDKIVEAARARIAADALLAGRPADQKAYTLALVNTKTRAIIDVGIYSENEGTITHDGTGAYVRLGTSVGTSYAEAYDYALTTLRSNWFSWLGEVRDRFLESEAER